jgi:hypothetical protein
MKQILNNILNANSWLFLELVIITVVALAVFEPAIVNLYYRSLPLGYDNDQLLYAETAVNGECLSDADDNPKDPYDTLLYDRGAPRPDTAPADGRGGCGVSLPL